MTLDFIINTIFTILLGIVAYFLKRTMNELDKVRDTVNDITREYATQDKISCLKEEMEDIKLNYTPKTEFEKLDQKIDKVTEKMNEVQLNAVSKQDFFIKMSELASTLERMEDKMERYRDGK